MKKTLNFWYKSFWALLSLFFVLFIVGSFLYVYLASQLPNVDSLKTVRLQVPLRIYTQDGKLIQEYGEKRRIPVSYEEIPKTLVYALLATEDQRFFEHSGVDILGLGRATVRMIKTGTKSQGGSTITMQVARNFFLTRKKTFLRKFNEILLAIKIDRELSKEKILELYFNVVYLGNRAYGVQAAAEIYYGKTLKELNLAEMAMIAGLPQAPSTQNPITNPRAAKKRRNHVLERLLEEKYIDEQQYQEAVKQPVIAKYHGTNIEVRAPYVAEMIRQSLFEHFGAEAYTRGYKVFTTIKSPLQLAANQAVADNLMEYDTRHGYRGPAGHININSIHAVPTAAELKKLLAAWPRITDLQPALVLNVHEKSAVVSTQLDNQLILSWNGISWARPALKKGGWMGRAPQKAGDVLQAGDVIYIRSINNEWQLSQLPQVEGALVAMNPQDGALEALVGGFNFEKSKFNRATQATRQPGSSFKPFLYAAALNSGYTLASLINDSPIVVDDPGQASVWRPHNVHQTFSGPMRLKKALVSSSNLVSIRILNDLGFDYSIDFMTHFGFQKQHLPRALSLALGSLTVTPMELTAAYAVFANGGFKIEPYLIDHINDEENHILLQATPVIACDKCSADKASADLRAPRVLPADVAFLMNTALRDVIQQGTGRAAKVLNRQDIAGKTGTTNDQVDAWFSGFNPELVVTTWVGYDTPMSLHEYAAGLALPVWINFMKTALKNRPEVSLTQPENVVAVNIDPNTGSLAKANQSNAIVEYFREQDVPTETEGTSLSNSADNPAAVEENLF